MSDDPARDLSNFIAAHVTELPAVVIQQGMDALQSYLDELDAAITDGMDISAVFEQNAADWRKQKEAIDGTRQ